ncbi:DoxX family protein [Mycolicibacterium sp. A43C]
MIASGYDVALLLLRVVLGLTMAAHGYNKLLGAGGIAGTAQWFASIGMRPGAFHARLAAVVELVAGACLAIGFLTPLAAAAFVSLMTVAAWTVHRGNGFFVTKDGWEYNLVLAVGAVALAGTGAGGLSVDSAVLRESFVWPLLGGWAGMAIAVAVGLVGSFVQLAMFFRPQAPDSS